MKEIVFYVPVAQVAALRFPTPTVEGSSPSRDASFSVGLPERSKGAVYKTVVRRFESGTSLQFFLLTVAQLEERLATNQEVADSNSAGGSMSFRAPDSIRCAARYLTAPTM